MAETSVSDRTKRCGRCGELKLQSEFPSSRRKRDGLSIWCSRCNTEYKTEKGYRERKRCSQCNVIKVLDEFVKARRNRDGYRSWCLECYRPHNAAKQARYNQQAERAVCACGCGQQVKYPGAKYLFGHRVPKPVVRKVDTDGTDQPKKYERRKTRTHKCCTACGEVKPVADFHHHRVISKSGEESKQCASRCKPCAKEALGTSRSKQGPERKGELRNYQRYGRYLRDFGLTPKQVEDLKASQDDKCAVCKERKRLVLDHCHESGRHRGFLCSACNLALGLVKEDESFILSLLEYIRKHRPARSVS